MAEFKSSGADDDEIIYQHTSESKEDDEFDAIITVLESIVFDEKFNASLDAYYAEHCDVFEDTAENKLEYTKIFDDYTKMVEDTLERSLSAAIPGFKMSKLEKHLVAHRDELGGEAFELLNSLGDFDEFKMTMISEKQRKLSASKKAEKAAGLDFQVSGRKV